MFNVFFSAGAENLISNTSLAFIASFYPPRSLGTHNLIILLGIVLPILFGAENLKTFILFMGFLGSKGRNIKQHKVIMIQNLPKLQWSPARFFMAQDTVAFSGILFTTASAWWWAWGKKQLMFLPRSRSHSVIKKRDAAVDGSEIRREHQLIW